MKKIIRLTESELRNMISESVNSILQEMKLTGKSGQEYGFHGDNPYTWFTLYKLRDKQKNDPNRISNGREEHNQDRDMSNASSTYGRLKNNYPYAKSNRWWKNFDKLTTDIADDLY